MYGFERMNGRLLAIPLVFALIPWPASSQSASPKLNLSAELVLTSDFCSAEMKKGNGLTSAKDKFLVGKTICSRIVDPMSPIFASFTKLDVVPAPNSSTADVVLVPKVGHIGATQKSFAFSNRELVVILEWTALDRQGKTLWIGTVRAEAKRHMGNVITHGDNMRKITDDVVYEAIQKSIQTIGSAPELQKLAR